MIIEDGTGNKTSAKVNKNFELTVRAIQESEQTAATEQGDSYNVNSGLITLTGSVETAVLYVKNNEARDLVINSVVVIFGPSTNGVTTDTNHIRFYRNTTTGSIVANIVDAPIISNRNFGSSNTLTADVYKGDGGTTQSGGTSHIESLVNVNSRIVFTIDEILTKGDSICITYEPLDSNTSMKTMTAIICHLEDANK